MLIIRHRVNKIEELKNTPKEYGVEIDIRGYGPKLLLNHEPIDFPEKYDELEEYLKEFNHAFIIFNIKEAGIENRIIELAKKYKIENYFLLDVEFPFLYYSTRKDKFRKIAVRYSEAEPIEAVEAQILDGETLLDWVWIDVNTRLPLNKYVLEKLSKFKLCLVCPDRWGRPQDVDNYIEQAKKLNFKPDAVMTTLELASKWKEL